MVGYVSGTIVATDLSTSWFLGLHKVYIFGGLREAIKGQIAETAQSDSRRDHRRTLSPSDYDSYLAGINPSGSPRNANNPHGQAWRSKCSSQSYVQRRRTGTPGPLELVRGAKRKTGGENWLP